MVSPASLVGAGATVGALLRYGTNQYVGGVVGSRAFPYGTLAVNVVGSFVLAFVTFAGANDAVLSAIGTGACGSYTTFSSFPWTRFDSGRTAIAASPGGTPP